MACCWCFCTQPILPVSGKLPDPHLARPRTLPNGLLSGGIGLRIMSVLVFRKGRPVEKILARFRYLRNTEAIFAIGFPPLFLYFWSGSAVPVNLPLRLLALALVCFVLAQGALFWHLKLQSVATRKELPNSFRSLFLAFKFTNLFLFAVFIAWASQYFGNASTSDLWWSGGIFVFAVLEHINYYHYQLMYDTAGAWKALSQNRRLRRAALS